MDLKASGAIHRREFAGGPAKAGHYTALPAPEPRNLFADSLHGVWMSLPGELA